LETGFVYIIPIVLGLLVGSFLNVCIYRLPRGISIVRPRSFCPSCGKGVRWYDNVPLLSYVLLRGRCRDCGGRISVRYPIVEALSSVISLLVYYKFGRWDLYVIYYIFLSAPLILIIFVDLEHQIIPDLISIPGIFFGIISRFLVADGVSLSGTFRDVAIDTILGILVGGGMLAVAGYLYYRLRKIEGIGGGDVKLAAMLGAFFGWQGAIVVLLVSSFLGSLVGLFLIFVLKKDTKYAIPYGPFLSVAAFIYLFFGRAILLWYTSLI